MKKILKYRTVKFAFHSSNPGYLTRFFEDSYVIIFSKTNPEEIIQDRSSWVLNMKNEDLKGIVEYLLKNSECEFKQTSDLF